jgi:glycosyltransferase involved in cell wall biosynthesis
MISVIMPVYNNSQYLGQCIDSILSQTYKDFEFIILDDHSSEPIGDLINSYNDERIVSVKNGTNIGLTKSLNKCLDLAKGDIIARQDSDDISLPNRFERQLAKMEEGFDLVSCWGKTVAGSYPENKKFIRDPYLDNLVRNTKDVKERLLKENCILGPAAIYSREVVDKIGYYDETLYYAQDYNYWIRLLKFFDIGIVEEDLYLRRRHEKSVRNDKRHKSKKDNILERVKSRAKEFPIIKEVKGGL